MNKSSELAETLKTVVYLRSKNVEFKILHMPRIAKTADDIKELYGCSMDQILKALVLIGDTAVIVAMVQGPRKVSFEKLKTLFSQRVLRLATAQEVEQLTGYTVGGVSPFGMPTNIQKVIDTTAFDQPCLNFGAGTPFIGIEIASDALRSVWDGLIADIS